MYDQKNKKVNQNMKEIDNNYTKFYKNKNHIFLYPTEFVVRTFLASYPELDMKKLPVKSKILDVGCGDGRNAVFLLEQGFEVYGTEITEEICSHTEERIKKNLCLHILENEEQNIRERGGGDFTGLR